MVLASQGQIMLIEPSEGIVFKGPFTNVVTSHLKLTNPTYRQICFKVKTTAPKQYCVRPNSGFIAPNGVANIAVMLQPFDFNAEEKNKHKFMIQAARVPEGETSLDNIWKNLSPGDLVDSKLRVMFEVPDQNNADKTVLKQSPSLNSANGVSDAELRRYQTENQGLQQKIQQFEEENDQLRARVSSLSASTKHKSGNLGKSSTSDLGSGMDIKLMHIIIAAVVALLIGLIFGKVI